MHEGRCHNMNQLFYFILLFTSLIITKPLMAQKKYNLHWSVAATLPNYNNDTVLQPGVAGAFAGVHNNILIIAGGANFPAGMPWEGGKKMYHNEIYILTHKSGKKYNWFTKKKFLLSQPIAYGASVSSDSGVICVGGENEQGISTGVFAIRWDNKKAHIMFETLPELPLPLTNVSATICGDVVYVGGGETTGAVSDKFMCLDLKNLQAGWQQLPSIPMPVSNAVMVAAAGEKSHSLFLIGGRRKTNSGISELYSSVLEFDLLKKAWISKTPLPYALAAGTGVVDNNHEILLFGGDRGAVFNKTEQLMVAIDNEKDATKKQLLLEEKRKLQINHPGFSDALLSFNMITDKWEQAGIIHFNTPVTTTAVKWNRCVFIISGEIRAGVRTPQILSAKIF